MNPTLKLKIGKLYKVEFKFLSEGHNVLYKPGIYYGIYVKKSDRKLPTSCMLTMLIEQDLVDVHEHEIIEEII